MNLFSFRWSSHPTDRKISRPSLLFPLPPSHTPTESKNKISQICNFSLLKSSHPLQTATTQPFMCLLYIQVYNVHYSVNSFMLVHIRETEKRFLTSLHPEYLKTPKASLSFSQPTPMLPPLPSKMLAANKDSCYSLLHRWKL